MFEPSSRNFAALRLQAVARSGHCVNQTDEKLCHRMDHAHLEVVMPFGVNPLTGRPGPTPNPPPSEYVAMRRLRDLKCVNGN